MPASRVDLILRGGTIVTAADAYEASVAVQGERIIAIGPDAVLPEAEREIDVRGSWSSPAPSTATSTWARSTTTGGAGRSPPRTPA